MRACVKVYTYTPLLMLRSENGLPVSSVAGSRGRGQPPPIRGPLQPKLLNRSAHTHTRTQRLQEVVPDQIVAMATAVCHVCLPSRLWELRPCLHLGPSPSEKILLTKDDASLFFGGSVVVLFLVRVGLTSLVSYVLIG